MDGNDIRIPILASSRAICMRAILSHGLASILNLAKNAGRKIEQIEWFDICNLKLSAKMIKNLQIYGDQ